MTDQDRQVIVDTIKATVNGKIDILTKEIIEIKVHLKEQDEAMAPAIETIETLNNGRKFILWICTPVVAVGGMMAVINAYLKS
jgi:hypothetical protein